MTDQTKAPAAQPAQADSNGAETPERDQLFLIAEGLAQDFSLFPSSEAHIDEHVQGLLPDKRIRERLKDLTAADIDAYIEQVVAPAEDPTRTNAKAVLRELGRIVEEESDGPFYTAVIELPFPEGKRPVGFIAQDRSVKNGVWGPAHHLKAAARIDQFSKRSIPIVSLMDTPGADAEAEANANNQAHSISRLIAEMCNVDVPNLGIIFGLGYSGGAIPLAASNLILSVRDGVFSTIQPKGLANIARRYNVSWQECAKIVGVSPYELYDQGNIDGVIDYVPGEGEDQLANFRNAITTGIAQVEQRTSRFVWDNPYILDHYRRELIRYLEPSERARRFEASASLNQSKNPTEYTNVFGLGYRYLRYLGTRQRIKATTTSQYGRLAPQEIPRGQLDERAARERQKSFLSWLQDPEKVVYDDALAKAWRSYKEKQQALGDERGRIAQLIFGEPKKNFDDARTTLLLTVTMYLYNRWKVEAAGNLRALCECLRSHAETRQLLRVDQVQHPGSLVTALKLDSTPLAKVVRDRFTHEGRKLLRAKRPQAAPGAVLVAELNMAMSAGSFLAADGMAGVDLSDRVQRLVDRGESAVRINRALLEEAYGEFIAAVPDEAPAASEMTVLDVLLDDELRDDVIVECQNLLLFDAVYDQTVSSLDGIAEEAHNSRALSRETVGRLLDNTLSVAAKGLTLGDLGLADESPAEIQARLRTQFLNWFRDVNQYTKAHAFLQNVEEWKKARFPSLSDTLFVVVTFLFDRLVPAYRAAEEEGKQYNGSISPRFIGRRKDFWNRLDIAYRDLLIQNTLNSVKRRKLTPYAAFIETFFSDFEELFGDLLSSDPVQFPGFRISIEQALEKGMPPCGIVTGIGNFRLGERQVRCGAVVSNVDFQAGAFDMASAEKMCKLLVECAQQRLPVICFISSGGMQTKEGAGALFSMAAVNDRITRFVRDNDLPVVVFGYGDCTGGAQASFVTHPLVQTYYFSGTNMPFAGQIVVPSNLPSHATLSNYLSLTAGSMQGLVQHPFAEDLDEQLRKVDPDMPMPRESVAEVVDRILLAGSLDAAEPAAPRREKRSGKDLIQPVKRTLIHARGCTAVKLIRGAQAQGIEVVLVQSDPDMESLPVDMLGERDKVVCIGGNTPDESYLNAPSVVQVAEFERVDSLHPGIGFLSENSQFAELVRSHGINFVGPPVSSMDTMGNKSNAINTSLRLGVPVVPGSHGILTDVDKAADVAEDIGYPVLIKAVHGGGGKGIQVVEAPEQFAELFHQVRMEARSAFGNGDVYLEKFVTSLRHIEVQLLRDTHGNTFTLGLRDCSVQRNKQKIIEESGSTMLPKDLEEQCYAYAAAIADEVGYLGAGTVEFIYDLPNNAVYFMEMNTRLQVEHPVTEKVTGIDIVGCQFRIAGGESLAGLEIGSNGYSIELRITAETAFRDNEGKVRFRPDPGEITECVLPEREGIDVIGIAGEGKVVSPFYDSMIVQLVGHAADRDACCELLLDYLDSVTISGIRTNIPLLKRILRDEVFRGGDYDTGFIEVFFDRIDADALIEEIEASAGGAGQGLTREAIAIEGSDEVKVLAPGTGIFYATPSPTEPAYVQPGDVIGVSKTLCQLEAMKIFTPLSLEDFNTGDEPLYDPTKQYRVSRVNIATGQQVSAGDLLFVVKPE